MSRGLVKYEIYMYILTKSLNSSSANIEIWSPLDRVALCRKFLGTLINLTATFEVQKAFEQKISDESLPHTINTRLI